ncbi:MAG: DUF6249 domain-containing protein [Anaeromyxobacter sp.]
MIAPCRVLPALVLALPAPALADDLAEGVTAVLATATVFFSAVAIIGLVLYAGHRARVLRHETIRLALEKGQPLPPGLLDSPRREPRAHRDLRLGLNLLAVGIGLAICLGGLSGWQLDGPWSVGVVPALLGCGYLLTWTLIGRGEPRGGVDASTGQG